MKRSATQLDYSQRIGRALNYVHANLDSKIDLEKVAEVACFSPFHFHRVYRAITGETLAATLVRLRLHRAAVSLSHTDTSLATLARRAGYGSLAAFSRAFRMAYGVPPSRFRQQNRKKEAVRMPKIQIVDRQAQSLVVTEHRGAPHRIGEAFDRLVAWAEPRGLLATFRQGFSVYLTDINMPEAEQRALAGFAVEQIPESDTPEVAAYVVHGGRHAVALHHGPYASLSETWGALYRWIGENHFEPADRPAFEINLNNPRETAPEDLQTQVCVPLK